MAVFAGCFTSAPENVGGGTVSRSSLVAGTDDLTISVWIALVATNVEDCSASA